MKKILLLTPLVAEKEFLRECFAKHGWSAVEQQHGKLTVLSYNNPGIFLSLSGHGKTQSGIQTQYLLNKLPDISAVICAGAGGSLTQSVMPGDIVVAEKTIEHDYTLRFLKRPLPEFKGHPQLLTSARAVKFDKIHFGAIASGDEDVIDHNRAGEVSQKTGAIAVAWEGAGVARACAFNSIPFLEIRAITDSADSGAEADFRRHLEKSMARLAEFVGHLSENLL